MEDNGIRVCVAEPVPPKYWKCRKCQGLIPYFESRCDCGHIRDKEDPIYRRCSGCGFFNKDDLDNYSLCQQCGRQLYPIVATEKIADEYLQAAYYWGYRQGRAEERKNIEQEKQKAFQAGREQGVREEQERKQQNYDIGYQKGVAEEHRLWMDEKRNWMAQIARLQRPNIQMDCAQCKEPTRKSKYYKTAEWCGTLYQCDNGECHRTIERRKLAMLEKKSAEPETRMAESQENQQTFIEDEKQKAYNAGYKTGVSDEQRRQDDIERNIGEKLKCSYSAGVADGKKAESERRSSYVKKRLIPLLALSVVLLAVVLLFTASGSKETEPVPVKVESGEMILEPFAEKEQTLTIEAYGTENYYIFFSPKSEETDIESKNEPWFKVLYYMSERMGIYVSGGDTVQIDIPMQQYDIYVAVGGTWYGEELLFGEETVCYKREDAIRYAVRVGDDGSAYTESEPMTMELFSEPADDEDYGDERINLEDFPHEDLNRIAYG